MANLQGVVGREAQWARARLGIARRDEDPVAKAPTGGVRRQDADEAAKGRLVGVVRETNWVAKLETVRPVHHGKLVDIFPIHPAEAVRHDVGNGPDAVCGQAKVLHRQFLEEGQTRRPAADEDQVRKLTVGSEDLAQFVKIEENVHEPWFAVRLHGLPVSVNPVAQNVEGNLDSLGSIAGRGLMLGTARLLEQAQEICFIARGQRQGISGYVATQVLACSTRVLISEMAARL